MGPAPTHCKCRFAKLPAPDMYRVNFFYGMTTPLSLRLRLSLLLGLYGSVLLAPASFALTSSEVDSLTIKASRGNAIAQYTLGLALADPREPAYEPAQAYVWLSLASLNGTTSKALSTLTQQLSPADLAEGKRRLEAAIADPVSPAISPITPSADSNATSPVISRSTTPAADPDKLGIELAAAHKEKELVKAELTAQLADTRKRIAIAEAALESKDREITLLGARLTGLNRTLAGGVNPPSSPATTATPVPASAELTSLRNERDQLQLSANATTHELAELRAKFARSTFDVNAQREKLDRLGAEVAAARRAQTLAEAEGGNLKAAAQLAAAERRTADAQLKTATAELDAVKEAAARPPVPAPLASTVKALEAELAALTMRLTEANRLASTATTDLTAKNAEITALQARVDAASLASGSLPALQSERDRLAETLKSRDQAQAQLTAQLTQATAEAAGLRNEIAQLQSAATASATELTTLRSQVAAATQAAATAASATASPAVPPAAAAELEALRTQLAAAQTTIEDQRTGLTQAVENLAGARKTISLITADLVAVQDLLREARTPNTPSQTPMPAQVSSVELEAAARLAELEKAKITSDTQLAAALRSFTLQQTEITRLQTALASINDECIATGAKLAAATTELSTLRPQAASASAATTETEILRAQLTSARHAAAEQSTAAAAAAAGLADARKTVDAATAELVTTRDQLRQTQATAEATAIELQQANTRLALVGSLPAGTTPSRQAPFPTITLNLPPAPPAAPVAQPPAVKLEAPKVAAARYHTVGTGDTLTRIAKQYYGNASRWNDILEANRDVIRNPDNLAPGTKLRLP